MTEPHYFHDSGEEALPGFSALPRPEGNGLDAPLPAVPSTDAPQENEIQGSSELNNPNEPPESPTESGVNAETLFVRESAADAANLNPTKDGSDTPEDSSPVNEAVERSVVSVETPPRSAIVLSEEADFDGARVQDAFGHMECQSPKQFIPHTETLSANSSPCSSLGPEAPPSDSHDFEAHREAETQAVAPVEDTTEPAKERSGFSAFPTTKPSTRVLQLKAKFERQRQAVTDSELQPNSDGTHLAATRRDRRQSESARPSSPLPADTHAPVNQSVRSIRSRFERLSRGGPSPKNESKTIARPPSSRKLGEETLLQLGAVDIAARYGKTYRRKDTLSSVKEPQAVHGGPNSPAASHAADKRTVECESPAELGVESKYEAPSVERGGTGGAFGDADMQFLTEGQGDPEALVVCASEQVGEAACVTGSGQHDPDDNAGITPDGQGQTEGNSPSAGVCGSPSPEIGRLAALVAAQAQNYGKPLPRRLLTRQDTDAC